MIFVVLFLNRVFSETSRELDYFLEQDIHILFSAYNHMQLAEKVETGSIVGVDRYLDAKEFRYDDRSMITKNGSGYEIRVGGAKLCKNNNMEVVKCGDGTGVWNIERKTFGFNISMGGSCMTEVDKDSLKLRKCTDTDDQLFTFKIASGPDKCDGGGLTIETETRKDVRAPEINIYSVNKGREHIRPKHTEKVIEDTYPVWAGPGSPLYLGDEEEGPVRRVVKRSMVVGHPVRHITKRRLPVGGLVRTSKRKVVYSDSEVDEPYEEVQVVAPGKKRVRHIHHPDSEIVCKGGVCSKLYTEGHRHHRDFYEGRGYLESGVEATDRLLFES